MQSVFMHSVSGPSLPSHNPASNKAHETSRCYPNTPFIRSFIHSTFTVCMFGTRHMVGARDPEKNVMVSTWRSMVRWRDRSNAYEAVSGPIMEVCTKPSENTEIIAGNLDQSPGSLSGKGDP